MAQPAPSGFRLRAGDETLPAAAGSAALAGFVDSVNHDRRIDGVPDELNPEILDTAKVAGFVAALPSQPAETLSRLAGHDLYLDAPGLQLRATSPIRAASFAAPFALQIVEIQGQAVLTHTSIHADLALAKSRASEAARLLPALTAEAAKLEHEPGDARRLAQERRFAVAGAWFINAEAWLQAAPDDPAAKAQAAEAEAARNAAAIPPRRRGN